MGASGARRSRRFNSRNQSRPGVFKAFEGAVGVAALLETANEAGIVLGAQPGDAGRQKNFGSNLPVFAMKSRYPSPWTDRR